MDPLQACRYLFNRYNYMVSVNPEFEIDLEEKDTPYETCKPFLKSLILKFHPDRRLQWDDKLKELIVDNDERNEIVRLEAGKVIEYLELVKGGENEPNYFYMFFRVFSNQDVSPGPRPIIGEEPSASAFPARRPPTDQSRTANNSSSSRPVQRYRSENDASAARLSGLFSKPLDWDISKFRSERFTRELGRNPDRTKVVNHSSWGEFIYDLDELRVRYDDYLQFLDASEEQRKQNDLRVIDAKQQEQNRKEEEQAAILKSQAEAEEARTREPTVEELRAKKDWEIKNTEWWKTSKKKGGSKRRKRSKSNKRAKSTKRKKTTKKTKGRKSRRMNTKRR